LKSLEQKFFDAFMLLVGIWLGSMISIAVFANFTSQDYVDGDNHSNAERIMPIGQFALIGDVEVGNILASQQQSSIEIDRQLLSGPEVYDLACSLCHQSPGVAGAPVFGDISAWTPRIQQGLDTLENHAINGYIGEAGYMPPKGGRLDLSNDEVIEAIGFMLEAV